VEILFSCSSQRLERPLPEAFPVSSLVCGPPSPFDSLCGMYVCTYRSGDDSASGATSRMVLESLSLSLVIRGSSSSRCGMQGGERARIRAKNKNNTWYLCEGT